MNEIVSPCVSICIMNEASGFCEGCWRTRDEIAGWRRMDDDERWDVIDRLRDRREEAGIGRKRRRTRRSNPAS